MELTPAFKILIDGYDSTNLIQSRLISIVTNDGAGIKSDSCNIVLDDYDDRIAIPKTNALIEIYLGYKETGLMKIGNYYAQNFGIEGIRQTINIKGNAIKQEMQSQISQNLTGTVEDIVSNIASKYGLKSAVDQNLKNISLNLMQFGESDMNVLTRLASQLGATSKTTNGYIVFANALSGVSVSGLSLASQVINKNEVSSFDCDFNKSTAFNIVFAKYYDKDDATYKYAHAGEGDVSCDLKEIYSDESSAQQAAEAKLKNQNKTKLVLNLETIGRPNIFAETPISLQGFSRKIYSGGWIVTKVSHSFSASGFTTSITCTHG